MAIIRQTQLPEAHPGYLAAHQMERALAGRVGGLVKLREIVPLLFRQAIDEVIDTPRTGRVHENELESAEKAYLGTKIEVVIRNFLRIPSGIQDLRISGLDIVLRHTFKETWTVSRGMAEKTFIIAASDQDQQTCSFGIFASHLAKIDTGQRQGMVKAANSPHFKNVHWVFANRTYPSSFWSQIGESRTHRIMRGITGDERIRTLFREVQDVPIHRNVVLAVGQKTSAVKQIRKNRLEVGSLAREGIAILSGKKSRSAIAVLGIGRIRPDEFISVKPRHAYDIHFLRLLGEIA